MGLDMYLEARKYVSKIDNKATTDYDNPVLTENYKMVLELFPENANEYSDFAGAEVSLNIGYWRKANAIHGWFVENCAAGVDECQPIHVNPDKLRELRAIAEHLLENRTEAEARKHLAPAQGFFFGTYEIDEWYWNDLERTKKILDKAITLAEDNDCGIVYQASW